MILSPNLSAIFPADKPEMNYETPNDIKTADICVSLGFYKEDFTNLDKNPA